MEKLQELLKEYQLSKWEWVRLAWPDVEVNDKEELVLEATLISKKYWFIQWLYDNDKIDMEEVADRMDSWGTDNSCDVPNILMNLAIKDEPLEFLVSILK